MSDNFNENKPKKPSHICFAVNEDKNGKSRWREISALWPSKNGGFNQTLDAVPTNGKIVCITLEELKRMRAEKKLAKGQEHLQNHNMQQNL